MAKKDFLLLNLLAIFIGAWFLQDLFLLNSDVSWLLHAAQLMLHGGTYATQFLETNPPLILYLYLPIVALKEYCHLNIIMALRVYLFFLSIGSLWLCAHYLKTLFANREEIRSLLLTFLAVIYLMLPLSDFGQREQLTMILISPYLFLLAARITNKDAQYAWLTGILAALGFCLKPFFLLVYALNEIYFILRARSLATLVRAETAAIILTTCFYLGVIYFIHHDYLTVILPLIAPYYYSIYADKLSHMLLQPTSIFIYVTSLFYLTQHKSIARDLGNILILNMTGFWLIYIFQRTDWYYHELPCLGYALLLMVYLYYSLLNNTIALYKTTAIAFSLLVFIIHYANYIYINIPYPFYLSLFFSLAALVSTLCIGCLYSAAWTYILTAVVVASTALFYQYLAYTIWYQHQIAFSAILMLLLLALILPHQNLKTTSRWLLLVAIGMLFFSYPCYRVAFVTSYSEHYFYLYRQFLAKAKPYQQHSIYVFTNTSELSFPLVDYLQQQYTSRFWSMIWLPQITNPRALNSYANFYREHESLLNLYIGFIVEDFKLNKPEYVLVDDRVNSPHHYYGASAPDFLALFKSNQSFKNIWAEYREINVIDSPPLCRFKIYSDAR